MSNRLLPLASIPSPAALTVQLSPDPFIDHVNTVMPIPNFNTSEYAQIKTVSDDSNFDFIYNAFQAPRYGIQRIANAVASTGAILKLPALEPNSSYSLSFPAPALQCNPISDSARDEVLDKLSDMLGCNVTVIGAGDTDGCESPTMYYAWAPNATDLIGLFNNDTAVIGTKANFSNTIGQFGTPGEEPTTLYVATQPLDNLISPSPVLKPWSLTNCSLYNSTYAIHVNFTSGAQRIEVESVKYANPVGYQAMLDAYGENAPGNVSDKTSDPFIGEPEPAVMLSDWTHFAYYSLMDALGTLLTGQIQVSYDNVLNVDTTHTMAMTTSLIESNELSSVYRYLETCISTPNACNVTDTEKTTAALQRNATMADLPVTAALEQLFQNLTLSLLSDNRYLTDPIKSASPTTKVTLLYPQNRYVYLWSRLVAAYLAALVFTLLACSAGFWALRANGASYSQRFSTVLRVATRARLEGGLRPHEIPEHGSPGKVGADPLPEGAGRVRVWLRDPEDKGGYDELRRETITVDGEK